MKKQRLHATLIVIFIGCSFLYAQTKEPGPIIKSYGEVWRIERPDFNTNTSKEFKVVFDIMKSPESHLELNKSIETAARFLNMHAQSGVKKENLKVVLVVHNQASKDILNDEGYQQRFSVKNPNNTLVTELLNSGVEIVLCGQSSLSRDYPIAEAIDGVQLALSAMTALVQLQDEGYQLIKF